MYELHGRVTIDPEVLLAIARLTTLEVPGVTRLVAGRVRELLHSPAAEGIQINVENNRVRADLYVAIQADKNLRQVAKDIQSQVARAIRDIVGMDIAAINIHIEDVDYPTPPA